MPEAPEVARPRVVEGMVNGALDAFAVHNPNVADLLSASMTLTVRAINAVLDGTKNPVSRETNRATIEAAVLKMWERVKSPEIPQ